MSWIDNSLALQSSHTITNFPWIGNYLQIFSGSYWLLLLNEGKLQIFELGLINLDLLSINMIQSFIRRNIIHF